MGIQGELDCKQIPNPQELDTAPRHWGGKLDISSGVFNLNYITNLVARLRNFKHHIFTEGWGIRPQLFRIV